MPVSFRSQCSGSESSDSAGFFCSEETRTRDTASAPDSVALDSAIAGVRAEFSRLQQEIQGLRRQLGEETSPRDQDASQEKVHEKVDLSQDAVRLRMSRRAVSACSNNSRQQFESEASNGEKHASLWPACLQPRHDGASAHKGARQTVGNISACQGEVSLAIFKAARALSALELETERWTVPMLHPGSRAVHAMGAAGVLVTVFEVISAPFVLAWDVSTEGALLYLSAAALLFWLMDLALSFNTGAYIGGRLEMRRPQIARFYARFWLPLDGTLVVVELVYLLLEAAGARGDGLHGAVRVMRCAKVLRMARVLRFAKRAMLWCVTFKAQFGVQIATFTCCTVLLNHVLCCLWWLMGTTGPTDTGRRWTDLGEQVTAPVTYQYLSSLHWVVAQLTLGSSDVVGANSLERSYTCTLLFLALILGSCLISIISGQIVNLIMLQQDRTKELTVLRRFLKQEGISTSLASDVQRQAVERLASPLPLVEEDVKALGLVARSLRFELKYETRLPHLMKHALFFTWGHTDMRALKDLCRTALFYRSLAADDDLFIAAESAEHSYRLLEGAARYVQSPSSSMVTEAKVKAVVQGASVAEASLWVHWKHVGSFTAKVPCKVLAISAEGLAQVMGRSSNVNKMSRTYGQKFHQRVVVAMPPLMSWPDDLHVPFTDSADLLSSDNELRWLKVARDSGSVNISQEQYDLLREEVKKDKCSLSSDESGQLSRVVSLVTMSIYDDEGRTFSLLGKVVNGMVSGGCALPGCKRTRGELPQDSIGNLLAGELRALSGELDMGQTSDEIETRPSETYGIDTTYLKIVQEAAWTGTHLNMTVTRSQNTHGTADLPQEFVDRDVYIESQGEGGTVALYAWLDDEEFIFFRSTGKCQLTSWLQSLAMSFTV